MESDLRVLLQQAHSLCRTVTELPHKANCICSVEGGAQHRTYITQYANQKTEGQRDMKILGRMVGSKTDSEIMRMMIDDD